MSHNKAINNTPTSELDGLISQISELVAQGRAQIRQSVNQVMVQTYWQVGRLILEHEQQGAERTAYGKQQLQRLSAELTDRLSKGFDVTNLRMMRRFYQVFSIR